MKKGAKVSFFWEIGPKTYERGTGEVISDAPDENGRVLVAVDPVFPEARHFVILCTVTWLAEVA